MRRIMRHLHKSPIALLVCLVAAALSGCHDSNHLPTPTSPVFVTGTATGLIGSVVLQNNGGDSLTLAANGQFSFKTPVAVGSPYAVTVLTQPAAQTCTVSQGSGVAGSTNVSNVALTCTANTQTVGGTVSGLTGSLVLQFNGGNPLTITADGTFAFPSPVADNSAYAVAIRTQPTDETCVLAQGSGIIGSANVTNVTVTCMANAFTTGGTISGLTGTVVLQNNGADTQSLSTDGAFTFATPIDEGSPYLVTVKTQPATQTCSVTNASGTMGAARVTNVAVVCATNSYSAGGTVSGLIGTVVLQDNGSDSLTLSGNGPFTFITPVAQGGTYSVTVQTQPTAQTCTVANGSGTMGGANVTNITVTCSTNAYTVGGTLSGLSGTITLQNNGTNSTPLSTNGSFTFSTPIAEGSSYNVTVQTQPTVQTCTVVNGSGTLGESNVTNVSVNCSTNTTTVSASATATVPVGGGSGSITITNTGTNTAYDVSAMLPGGWSGVTQDSSGCASVAPADACTLTFTSTSPYVAQRNLSITGDNLTSPPTITLVFSMDGYLVWSVPTASSALVLASSDASSSQSWSPNLSNIAGITETSVGPPCNGATDGACDTAQIEAVYGSPYTTYAAGLCDEITSDNTGTVAMGTWYLPSICELGGSGQGAGCSSGLANIDSNLMQLGFGGFTADNYWSSTEYSGVPTVYAWAEYFTSGGGSFQLAINKGAHFGVRCVRMLTY
jgi:hypothetical protein